MGRLRLRQRGAPAEGGLAAMNGQLDEDAKKDLQKQIAESKPSWSPWPRARRPRVVPMLPRACGELERPREGPGDTSLRRRPREVKPGR